MLTYRSTNRKITAALLALFAAGAIIAATPAPAIAGAEQQCLSWCNTEIPATATTDCALVCYQKADDAARQPTGW